MNKHEAILSPNEDDRDVDWNDIRQVQDEIYSWAQSRWPNRTYKQTFDKLVYNEIPELLTQASQSKGLETIGPELADCFVLLMDLATMWEVDLPGAIRDKMALNYARTWEVNPITGIAQHVVNRALPDISNLVRDPEWRAREHPIAPPEPRPPTTPHCVFCRSDKHAAALDLGIDTHTIAQEKGYTHYCSSCKLFFDESFPF